jgi:hypothetical protein
MDAAELRSRYHALADSVERGVRVQLGDTLRLENLRDQVLAFRLELAGHSVRT